MPTYVNLTTMNVVVTTEGHSLHGVAYLLVDDQTAAEFGLQAGKNVTATELEAIRRMTQVPTTPLTPAPAARPAASATSAPPAQTRSAPVRLYAPPSVSRARAVASIVEIVSWFALVFSVLIGLLLVFKTEVADYGPPQHPYVGLGLGVAVGGAFQCLLVIMIATYIRAKMDLASRTS